MFKYETYRSNLHLISFILLHTHKHTHTHAQTYTIYNRCITYIHGDGKYIQHGYNLKIPFTQHNYADALRYESILLAQ